MSNECLRELLGGLLEPIWPGIQHRPQVKFQVRLEYLAATVHVLAKYRLRFIKRAAHIDVLRALAGEHKNHRRFALADLSAQHAFRVGRRQRLSGVGHALADHHPAVVKRLAADLQSKSDVGRIDSRVGLEVFDQAGGGPFESGGASGGEDHQVAGARLAGQFGRGRFLEHDVGIGAADAERADPGPTGRVVRAPLAQLVIHKKRAVGEIDFRIRPPEVQAGRQLLVLQSEHGFDQTGDAGGGIKVTDVALHGTNGTETLRGGAGAEGPG